MTNSMSKLKISLIFPIVLISVLGFLFCFSAQEARADTAIFYSTASDTMWELLDTDTSAVASWNLVHDSNSGSRHAANTDLSVRVVATISSGWYGTIIRRSAVYFDTSILPDNATINSAVLKLYGIDPPYTEFGSWTLQIQSGMPTYPQDPSQVSDYYYGYYSGDGGSLPSSSMGLGYKNIQLNSTGLGWINKTGTTKFMLREKGYDVVDSVPSYTTAGKENRWDFYASEKGSGYQPTLEVTYTVPVTPPTVTTELATVNLSTNQATLNGTLNSRGGASSCNVRFEYRKPGESGYPNITSWQVISADNVSFSATIGATEGFTPQTVAGNTYVYRAVAQNTAGTSYGPTDRQVVIYQAAGGQQSFKTWECTPGATQSCGNCGIKTCQSDGTWGACVANSATCTGNCDTCSSTDGGATYNCSADATLCTGNCDTCSGSGTAYNCAASATLCTGNCDTCSGSGTAYNCAASATLCTGNCDTCSGSGTAYNCAASATLCTGNCDTCSGSGTAYNCAGDNTLCSNNDASCFCSGSGTSFNCQACNDCYDCSAYACLATTEANDGTCNDDCTYCSAGTCTDRGAHDWTECTTTCYACTTTAGSADNCQADTYTQGYNCLDPGKYCDAGNCCDDANNDNICDLLADFTISALPTSLRGPKVSGTADPQTTITVNSLNSFNSAVTLSARWCTGTADTSCSQSTPSGLTPSFSANPVTPPANSSINSTLSIDTINPAAGNYYFRARGVSGTLIYDTSVVTLTIVDLSVTLSANPSSGTAPLNGVDLTATVSGTATGTINYKFDCTNDGSWDYIFDNISDNPKTVVDACNYASAATYTAKVRAERDVANPAEATATITVTSAPDFTISASPTSLRGPKVSGASDPQTTITVNSLNNFNLPVTLSVRWCTGWIQATSSAAWSPRNNYNNSLVYNNKMWILGGGSAEGYINDVWSSSDGINWTRVTPAAAWPGRKNHTPLVYNNKMWVMGGTDGVTVKNDVWYSTDGINWTQATSSAPWSARHAYSSAVYNNKMWILGGTDASGVKNDVWYSTDGINWTQATSSAAWSARAYFTTIVYDNKLWIMGGIYSSPPFYNDIWYSTDGVNWTQATSSAPWSARYRHTSLVFDNKMWILGGSAAEGNKNDVWYSTDGVNWTQTPSIAPWSARQNHTSVLYNEKIWVLGGIDDLGLKNDVWYGILDRPPSSDTVCSQSQPSGLTPSFSANPVTPPANSSINSTLSIDTINPAAGNYYFRARGVSGTLIYDTSVVTLTIVDLSVTLSANPSSGTAPLNGVDLTATVSGTATGTINYKFDCTNDGSWDYIFDNISDNPKTVVDACNYASATTYTAKVRVERDVANPAEATATITVTAAPDFTISALPTSLRGPKVSGASDPQTTVTVNSLNSFSSAVALSTRWCTGTADTTCSQSTPTGLTSSFSATPITPPANGSISSTLSIDTNNPVTGDYYFRARGVSGSLTHDTAVITLTIVDLSVTLTADPTSGTAPLNGVDLTADVGGTATGTVTFNFHCNALTSPATWEHTFPDIDLSITDASPVNRTDSQGHTHSTQRLTGEVFKVIDLCSYSSAGTYTPRVKVNRDVANPAEATAQITVNPGDTTQPTTNIKVKRKSTGEDLTAASSWLRADTYTIQFEDNDPAPSSGWKRCEYSVYDTQAGAFVVQSASRTCGNFSFDIIAGAPPYDKQGAGVYIIYSVVTDNVDLSANTQIGINFDFTPPTTEIR